MNYEKAKYYNDKIVRCAENQSTLIKTVDELPHSKAGQYSQLTTIYRN